MEAAVSMRGLVVRFGATTAVDSVALEIRRGEVFWLLGPNGAGKTTTMRVLTTLLPATEGSVSVLGVDVSSRPMEVRRLLGFVPQQLSADAAAHRARERGAFRSAVRRAAARSP